MSTKHIANQRLFNESWEHIHKQGGASVLGDGFCRYQTPKGLGCAFSVAIKDYDPRMEHIGAGQLLRQFADSLHEWIIAVDQECAASIQRAHDRAVDKGRDLFMGRFEAAMREVATRYSLEVPA